MDQMLTKRVLSEAIAEVYAARNEPAMIHLMKLMNILIESVRVQNDNVTPELLGRNQGKIEAYEGLKFYITRGIPGGIGA